MKTTRKAKGTWLTRFAIRLFTVVLGILVFWVLGFLVGDIRSLPGPSYHEIEQQHLDQRLVDQLESLEKQITDLSHQIDNQREKQRLVGDSSRNLQQTINQLIELQRLGIQKGMDLSDTKQASFAATMNQFFESQKKYQELGQTVADMLERKQALVGEKEQVAEQIELQRRPARQEFDRLSEKHRLKLAFLQLAILLPILAVAALVILSQRTSIYFPLYLAFGAAALFKVALVVHEYFPSKYFKYVLIGVLLLVVARLLVYFIRTVAFPKAQWLLKQYREAYERFLCPVCEYPIRTGPRRYLFWTRRTVNKAVVPTGQGASPEEKYTCPACGSALYEECPSCHQVRHAMLPHCTHCGAEKTIVKDDA